MGLNSSQKMLIDDEIKDFDKKVRGSRDYRINVRQIMEALSGNFDNLKSTHYKQLNLVFHLPEIIKDPGMPFPPMPDVYLCQCGNTVTRGDIREYIIDCLNNIIVGVVGSAQAAELGWNKDLMLTITQAKPDHQRVVNFGLNISEEEDLIIKKMKPTELSHLIETVTATEDPVQAEALFREQVNHIKLSRIIDKCLEMTPLEQKQTLLQEPTSMSQSEILALLREQIAAILHESPEAADSILASSTPEQVVSLYIEKVNSAVLNTHEVESVLEKWLNTLESEELNDYLEELQDMSSEQIATLFRERFTSILDDQNFIEFFENWIVSTNPDEIAALYIQTIYNVSSIQSEPIAAMTSSPPNSHISPDSYGQSLSTVEGHHLA